MTPFAVQRRPSPLSPRHILFRLDKIVRELQTLNDPNQVKALSDQAESIRYFTKKLHYDQDIQNAAAPQSCGVDKAATWGTPTRTSIPAQSLYGSTSYGTITEDGKHAMKLPNAKNAVVDIAKLRDYCLSTRHDVGKHKARVFKSSLGLTSNDADELRGALLDAAQLLDAVVGQQDEYGQRYTLDVIMVGASGHATIRSAWIVLAGEDFARLTTCYVL